MAHMAYMKVTGKKQYLISQGCNTHDSMGGEHQLKFKDFISILECNSLLSMTHLTKTFSPITITKNIDKSSPLLVNAFNNEEYLDVEIDFYRTSDGGHNEHFFSIKMFQAKIVGIDFNLPHVLMSHDLKMSEQISFSYRDVEFSHKLSGTYGSIYREGTLL